ncbi:MAG: oligoendopeptidase F, partial [Deltaproteobacteria bacterium]|nr:oligoendopeptidase F [Deltaproteobacteria bacterium]
MSGKTIPERKDIPDKHKWDLTTLFESDAPWETMFAGIKAGLVNYEKFKGHLKESVAVFREAIEFHLEFSRKIEMVYT